MTDLQRPVLLPSMAAALLEAWMQDKRTGYVQLNFTEGTIGNATIHCTIPIVRQGGEQ